MTRATQRLIFQIVVSLVLIAGWLFIVIRYSDSRIVQDVAWLMWFYNGWVFRGWRDRRRREKAWARATRTDIWGAIDLFAREAQRRTT